MAKDWLSEAEKEADKRSALALHVEAWLTGAFLLGAVTFTIHVLF